MKKFDLKKWYTTRNISQVDFAKMMGRDRETIRRIVNGKSKKGLMDAMIFCEHYEILKETKRQK